MLKPLVVFIYTPVFEGGGGGDEAQLRRRKLSFQAVMYAL